VVVATIPDVDITGYALLAVARVVSMKPPSGSNRRRRDRRRSIHA
jgi:hypothetical protein